MIGLLGGYVGSLLLPRDWVDEPLLAGGQG